MNTQRIECIEVTDDLARIVDGTAPDALYDHIASCDECRDLRHDAQRAAALVPIAAQDYVAPPDLDARVLAALDARPKLDATVAMKPEATVVMEPDAPRVSLTQAIVATSPSPIDTSPRPATVAITETPRVEPKAPVRRIAFYRRPDVRAAATIAAVVGVAATTVLAINGRRGPVESAPQDPIASASKPWSGKVATVLRAGKDKDVGVEACVAGKCANVRIDEPLAEGTRIRTDDRSRARIVLGDGTVVVLDRATEIELVAGATRSARLVTGTLVADVAHVEGAPRAHIAMPHGMVEVVGTKFSLTATDDTDIVEVTRGEVRVSGASSDAVAVRAGQEARIVGTGAPRVAPTTHVADASEWSELPTTVSDDEPLRGLGELRAKKPGETKERDHAVKLTSHGVKVRVVDNVARTEIDESFTNETSEELEGIFRLPLPPDAQIERLALEVNGKLEEGAFVDRDKAAAIWRGVIQHAAPQVQINPQLDIVWVPGPWRDPALLEWQRGGRFELRIFPIPAKGSRRVVLAYTQTIAPRGGVRRYTYPLAYDPAGSTTIDNFDVDVQVMGHDAAFGVHPRGYALAPTEGTDAKASRLALHQKQFVPAGDLSFEYALPDKDAEMTAWAYAPLPVTAAPVTAAPVTAAVKDAPRDDAAYVALALRPKLPRWEGGKDRLHVVVVDSSRSMFGEKWTRATALVSSMAREMDRRDRVVLVACDSTCRTLTREPLIPGADASERVTTELRGIEPEGATDYVAAIRAAATVGASRGDRELRVVYVSDGGVSAGPTTPELIAREVSRVLPASEGTVTVSAIGSEADTTSLGAVARGGGGVVVPFSPGSRADATALQVLAASYGATLRNPVVHLPPGLTAVAPQALDTIPAGGEAIVVARMEKGVTEITGTVSIEGTVGGESYKQTLPLHAVATSDAGNAFVPRLYASARIADLERTKGNEARAEIVSLSRSFAVASRHTSLLVLESPAMFHAFGLDRERTSPQWTGEDAATATKARGEIDHAEPEEMPTTASAEAGKKSPSGAGMGGSRADAPSMAPPITPAATATAAPMTTPTQPKPMAREKIDIDDDGWRNRRQPPRRMIPMRRIWVRQGSFTTTTTEPELATKIAAAEALAKQNPDNRTKLVDLYKLYARDGRIEAARGVAEQWSLREPLSIEALVARADMAARMGDREGAIRILGSVVDMRPDDVGAQQRLTRLFEAMGDEPRACRHRIPVAETRPADVTLVAAAVRCARDVGGSSLAERLLASAPEKLRPAVELASQKASTARAFGDVKLNLEWQGDADVDVALIDANGQRFSWLGAGKGSVSATDATSTRRETVTFTGLPVGSYLVEITRASSTGTAQGKLDVQAAGTSGSSPFVVNGPRSVVGKVTIGMVARLVPLE